MKIDYQAFLESKSIVSQEMGMKEVPALNPILFDFQAESVSLSLKRGRSAIFAGTGLGKTLMESEWARVVHEFTGESVLILAPLAVAPQSVREAEEKLGLVIHHVSDQSEVKGQGIYITNYERIHHFDASGFSGIVLDESSILKHQDSKTRAMLVDTFKDTPWKLACSATPAPNDHMELGNHSEFLGVMSMQEMLSMFFIHDGGSTQDWRLKGHAESDFWKWLASWCVCFDLPSDLGFEDRGFKLPDIQYFIHEIPTEARDMGMLFQDKARTLQELRHARKTTINSRCKKAAEIVNQDSSPWLIWCDLNDESELLSSLIEGSREVTGSDSDEHKETSMLGFTKGDPLRLVSKPSICGFGMNWQHCSKMIFVGVTHSFERFYQAVKRCHRFGQKNVVQVHIIISDQETNILESLKEKEDAAKSMIRNMVDHMKDITKEKIHRQGRTHIAYTPKSKLKLPSFL